MKVWVVVCPWDYTTADVIGVFATEKAARDAAASAVAEKRDSGESNLNVEVTAHDLESVK